jgi:hypothetical protein
MLKLVSIWLFLDYGHLKAATFDFESRWGLTETIAKSADSRLQPSAKTTLAVLK